MRPEKNIEVCDLSSSLVLYDIEKNNIFPCQDTASKKYMETFPNWSPAGDYLYYCRTDQINEDFDFMNIKYDIVRRSFNQESGEFGEPEVVFNAREKNKSVSFPDISPDGKYMVFTLHDHGTLPSWREEADLYLLDLKKGKVDSMCINSNQAESYHSWSSNGNWLVFSSKRGDGLTARLYFAYFNSPDSIGKPFVLPQKDPTSYDRIEKTYNKPEFIKGRIKIGPRDFIPASEKEPVKSGWIDHYNQL
jgi:dipeptidyl aminopeptidase/acylaminoacyl peptidase